jgi:t-SNARE complex subunit (syntaxin)
MNEKLEKKAEEIKENIKKAGSKLDDGVEEFSEQHGISKVAVWGIIALVVIGAIAVLKFLGFLKF